MSHGASIHRYVYELPITAEILPGISPERRWQANSASSRLESDTQLAMDRLLREYLAPKSPWE